jgi:hypothetical protein
VKRDAFISRDERFRYWLLREWDATKPKALFIMLNPSTADAKVDDATIRKCIGFSQRLGFGGFYVINLSAFRARHPRDLFSFLIMRPDLFREEKKQLDLMMQRAVDEKMTAICAWGSKGRKLNTRVVKILKRLRHNGIPYKALRFALDGTPYHPLMLPYECGLLDYHTWPDSSHTGAA